MRVTRAAAFLFFLVSILSAAEHRGRVRSGGLPIPGATVTAQSGTARLATSTGEAGFYHFQNLAAGEWSIEVRIFGFEPARREVTINGRNALIEWELALTAAAPPPARNRRGRGRANGGRARFQRLAVNQTEQDRTFEELSAMPAALVTSDLSQDATESFLVTGSLSQGLRTRQGQGGFGRGAGFGFGGQAGPAGNPFGGQTGATASTAGRFGRGPGGGGFGAGRGGRRGGGGRGGPGGRGARGGRGGGPGRGRGNLSPERRARIAEWMRRRGATQFGNRIGAGRNRMRMMAYFTLRNSAFDARPYSLTGQTVEKPSYGQGQFGGLLGGPLKIPKIFSDDKTFFFLNYRGSRSRNPYNATATVPSSLERAGDFSQSIAQQRVTIYDAATGQPFAGNRVPLSRIDPAANGLLPFLPLPNQNGRVQNYQFVSSAASDSDSISLRVNRNVSGADRLSFSYSLRSSQSNALQTFGFVDARGGRGQSARLGWTRNLRPDVINSLQLRYTRNRNQTLPYFAFGQDVAGELGITGTSDDPINYGPPNLTFTNFGNLTDASPSLRRDQTFQISEGVTLVRGSHNLSLGGDYRKIQLNNISDQNARGTLTFSGLGTSAFDDRGLPLAATGFDFADFLLGKPQSSSIRFGNPDTYFRSSAFSLYVQDDWRVSANFTINAGLRYEFLQPFHEKYDRLVNLDIAPGFTAVAPVLPGAAGPYSGAFPRGLIQPDRNNIGPRLGLAWKPFPKQSTLVRAGYGWYYNGSVYNQAAALLGQQPPFATTGTVTTSLDRVLSIQNGFATAPSQDITNTFAVDRRYLVGYAQTWNFAVQQNLPRSLVLEVGYLGTKGTRLDTQRSPNRAAPGSPLTAEERRRIGNAVGFTFDSSEGNSIYHAGQVRLSRRFQSGVSANLFYTWAKSIDNVSTFGGGAAVVAQDDTDLRAERGLSSFDQRHALTTQFVLSSPVARRASGAPSRNLFETIFRDWTLTGGLTANSGTPFTATILGNQANTGGTGAVGSGRADSTGLSVTAGAGFFNPAAFTTPPADRFGNASRNTIPGPGLFSLNFGIGRDFRLGEERRRMNVRLESTNVTNTVSYSRLGTTVNASNFGLATNTAAMRTMRLNVRFRF